MYLINKFEKNILENSLNQMKNEKSPSKDISKSSEQTQTDDVLLIVNHKDIILNRKNYTPDNENSNENQQNDTIKDKSESFEEPKIKRSSRKKSKTSYIPYNPKTYKDLNTFPKVLTRGIKRKNLKTKRIPPSKLKMDDLIISAEDANKISQAIKANPNLKRKSNREKHTVFHGWEF